MSRERHGSITSNVWKNTGLILLFTGAWLILVFWVNAVYNEHGKQFVQQMGQSSVLKPLIVEELPSELYEIAAGRKSADFNQINQKLGRIHEILDSLESGDSASEAKMTVILRTVDTYEQYVEKLLENVREQGRVDEAMHIHTTIINVAELIRNMVDEFIQISALNEMKNAHNRQVIYDCLMGMELIALIFLALFTAYRQRNLAAYITDNLKVMEDFSIQLAGGNLDRQVPETGVLELNALTKSMNVMAKQLNKLIDQVKIEQDKLKMAELKTLQAQINPHFLYNTLDTILWQAEEGKTESVIRMTQALADFFRISLNSGQEWTNVEHELRHVEGYLTIQKTRYHDILDYRIEVDKEIMSCEMLKLLLQPLVENALYHGIKEKRGGGWIMVTGSREGDRLSFCVRDTGKGMTPEQLHAVCESLKSGKSARIQYGERGSGFGLSNVDLRLRLYYHQEEGLRIVSGAEGTSVSFTVPMKLEEEERV